MNVILSGTREGIDFILRREFTHHSYTVERGEWQAKRDDRPQINTIEIPNVMLEFDVPGVMVDWVNYCKPSWPWAEDHFQERIGGEPLNPGEQYKNWPWYEGGVEEHKPEGQFSHTYMERFWPAHAGRNDEGYPYFYGIRYEMGDLDDLIRLLQERPYTRQAYLPIWFPEDLSAANQGERVPCSLGYLIQYNDESKAWDMWYFMRSVDFYRYLWDDIYMAGRLLQHICANSAVGGLEPGKLHMTIANLHIFASEIGRMSTEYQEEYGRRLQGAF